MIIKGGGNRNLIEREKYTVNSAGAPLFPNVSNINLHAESQSRFRIIQSNRIILECEFLGCLDECHDSTFLANIIDHLFPRVNPEYSLQFISKPCKGMPAIHPEKLRRNLLDVYFVSNIDSAFLHDQYRPRLRCDVFTFFLSSISRQLTVQFRFYLVL
jgi:hypothetical protein